ncbi:hypothetical protein RND71_013079 [Anisodus tanguticus]|uniref:Uncharacterized protein n=1 Tax=Anisodus tanguticus TaxID=243964 RepID=A0AAE1SH00_9SOLA|nr:hypothetical protein RND71_013079 [Anisodus tanguticus]
MKTMVEKASDAFMDMIVKREGSATGARLFKKQLKLEYQLLFALVNKVKTEKAILGTRKHMITMETLEECECMLKKCGVGTNSTISSLIEAQKKSTAEIQRLKAKNALLRAQLVAKAQEHSFSGAVEATNAKNMKLRAENEKLKEKIDELRDQMVQDQRTTSE